jgi:hypothetical protein
MQAGNSSRAESLKTAARPNTLAVWLWRLPELPGKRALGTDFSGKIRGPRLLSSEACSPRVSIIVSAA